MISQAGDGDDLNTARQELAVAEAAMTARPKAAGYA